MSFRFVARLVPLLMLLFFSACTRPCANYALAGADEFVTDSFKIRRGKTSILEMEGIYVPPLPANAMEEYKDAIAEDDILNIVVYHPTRRDVIETFQMINTMNGGFPVIDGELQIPDSSPISIVGLSLDQAKQVIEKHLREQIKDVEVFVSYRQRISHKVDLAGMVARPSFPVDGRIRLYEVLAEAKIAPGANLFASYLLRDGESLNVDFHRLVNCGDMSQNVVMHAGDKIFVAGPSDATVTLMGEVGLPRAINVPYGYISLREALVAAGGIPFTGDKQHIQVIRGNIPCPKVYILSWNHIVNLPNDSLLLMPGDTVYVCPKPLTEWNRFLNQLLPSFTGTLTGYEIYKISQ